MPDFGIGETLLALGVGGEAGLGGLFGAEAGAAALGAEAGAEAIGAGVGVGEALGAEAALGAGLTGAEALGGVAAGGEAATIGGASSIADLTGVTGIGTSSGTAALPAGAAPTAGSSFELASLVPDAASAGGAGPAAGIPAGGESLFGKLAGAVKANPLQSAGIGLGAGALGFNIWKGSQDSAERKQLSGNAALLGEQGRQLMTYLQSGTLPPGLQQQVTRATEAARARVIQNHARNGMPTDPSQNSALAQELNSLDERAMMEVAAIGERLMSTGIQEVGLANDLYAKLIGIDKAQSQGTGLAIGNFAAALAGRPPQPAERRA